MLRVASFFKWITSEDPDSLHRAKRVAFLVSPRTHRECRCSKLDPQTKIQEDVDDFQMLVTTMNSQTICPRGGTNSFILCVYLDISANARSILGASVIAMATIQGSRVSRELFQALNIRLLLRLH